MGNPAPSIKVYLGKQASWKLRDGIINALSQIPAIRCSGSGTLPSIRVR